MVIKQRCRRGQELTDFTDDELNVLMRLLTVLWLFNLIISLSAALVGLGMLTDVAEIFLGGVLIMASVVVVFLAYCLLRVTIIHLICPLIALISRHSFHRKMRFKSDFRLWPHVKRWLGNWFQRVSYRGVIITLLLTVVMNIVMLTQSDLIKELGRVWAIVMAVFGCLNFLADILGCVAYFNLEIGDAILVAEIYENEKS